MDKLTLGEAVHEYGFELCELVRIIQQENLKYESAGSNILLPEQELIKYKLRQSDYSVEEFRKIVRKYSGDSRELEEIAKALIENKRFELLFVEGMEEAKPIHRLLEEGEYEFLYLLFEEQEDVRRKVIREFGINEPLLAAEVGAQYQDWELVREALKYTSVKAVIETCPAARTNLGWLRGQINSEILSEASDYLDQAKEAIARIDPSAMNSSGEDAKTIRRTKNMEYREMLGLISRIRRAVSNEMGIKLPSNIRFSKPEGSYGTIGYDRGDLYHDHDVRMQPDA
ncbi:MAG: hypothetical protein AABY26_01320 [Nanoarchaeota archaeon]